MYKLDIIFLFYVTLYLTVIEDHLSFYYQYLRDLYTNPLSDENVKEMIIFLYMFIAVFPFYSQIVLDTFAV